MRQFHKMADIGALLGNDFNKIISDLYINQQMSAIEIAEKIKQDTKIDITPRSIQRQLKSLGIVRSFSQAFRLAISKGRKDYSHLRKPVKSSRYRKGICLKDRYSILKRDGFKCTLCGKTANDTILMIDHVIPVVRGGKNDLDNLRTLCRECNLGKMISEKEK